MAQIDYQNSNKGGLQDRCWRTLLDPGSGMTLRGGRLTPFACLAEV
ncbi:hypothetical protein RISK_004111 [Rhodopirellula islandica]|uniref:Uncharacterized protein n=1 Tax=Rhodopirellula islandica TaxID=595434 RepID=A0A0J1EDU2_RHOIS|nr:hypothetical protein RISK_004111 [Rhodopirellula islandica]